MVTTKPGVRFDIITRELVEMLDVLVRLASHPDAPASGLVITAGSNGTHAMQSKHYSGRAVDLRSRTFADEVAKARFAAALRRALGPAYLVLYEDPAGPNQHFHVQVRTLNPSPTLPAPRT